MLNLEIISWDETTEYKEQYSHNQIHLHQAYELLLLLEGEADILYYNRNHEVTYRYHAQPADLFLFASLEIHQVKITKFPYRRVGIRFSVNVLRQLFPNLALGTIYNQHRKPYSHKISLSNSLNFHCIKGILLSIHAEYLGRKPFYQESMQYLLGQFTIALYRMYPNVFPDIKSRNLCTLQQVEQYIQQNFSQPIHIEGVARKFYLSQSYLSKIFKEYTGLNPKQYLNLCRLAYARELLITTPLPLDAIAESSGIGSSNSLIRLFRKMMGITPGEYRRTMQEEPPLSHGIPLPPNSVAASALGTQALDT